MGTRKIHGFGLVSVGVVAGILLSMGITALAQRGAAPHTHFTCFAVPHTHFTCFAVPHTHFTCFAAPHTHFTCFAVRARARALRRRPRIFNGRRVCPNRVLRAHVPRIRIGAASRRLLPLLIAQSQIRCERACTQLRRHMSLCARCSWRAGLTKTSASHWGRGLSRHFTCATKGRAVLAPAMMPPVARCITCPCLMLVCSSIAT